MDSGIRPVSTEERCPFCGSTHVGSETVDVGVGSIACGPTGCYDCYAYINEDGKWVRGQI